MLLVEKMMPLFELVETSVGIFPMFHDVYLVFYLM